MKKLFALLLAAALLTGCGTSGKSPSGSPAPGSEGAPVNADPVVACATGTYSGLEIDGVAAFKGIRYGEYHPFLPATDLTTTTTDTFDATSFGENCLQPYDEVEIASQDPMSADCLFLNIWTKDLETTGKPVLVFIHGGSCIWGGTSDPTYDGQFFVRNLAEGEDCVFVTINYRMSILGGLDVSVLEGYTDEYAKTMNLSKCDQVQALKWVSENIGAWGGDPDNVTVMGQSAGGGAVEMLMADTDAQRYFQRAVIFSGTQSREAVSRETFTENSRTVCEILGVSSVDELTALTDDEIYAHMDEIIDALGKAHPGLKCADGTVISKTWWDDLVAGAASDIDLLIGGTNGEEDWYAIDWDNSVSEPLSDPNSIIQDLIDRDTARCGAYGRFYALETPGFVDGYLAMGDDPVMQAMDLYNDVYFNYPTYLIAETQSAHNSNTYLYSWEYAPDKDELLAYAGDSAEVSPWGRALHCMDLCFVLGTKEGYTTMTGDPQKMSDQMIAQARESVYHFALCGDPNHGSVTGWMPYNSTDRQSMVITADGEWLPTANYRQDIMAYMSQLQPYRAEP